MNAARLTRRWQEAAGDPARMAEALVDEIDNPSTGLVTRDFPAGGARPIAGRDRPQLRGEITSSSAQLGTRLTWRMITLLGVQIALVGILVTILVQALR
jgi:hypothetical protein